MDWKELLQATLNYVVPIAVGFVVLKLLPKLLPVTQSGIDWVKGQAANVKNELARTVLNRVITLVGQHVLKFEQTFIEDLKDKVKQGRVNPSDIPSILKEEKDKLLQQLKNEITTQGLWENLKELVGGADGSESLVFKWLDTVLESQVAQLPPSGLQTPKTPVQPAAVDLAPPAVPQQAAG